MAKKSFNPFKMWGAWVGGVIGAYLMGFLVEFFSTLNTGDFETIFENSLAWFNVVVSGAVIPLVIGGVFLGFLIGWGIHLLVRAFK